MNLINCICIAFHKTKNRLFLWSLYYEQYIKYLNLMLVKNMNSCNIDYCPIIEKGDAERPLIQHNHPTLIYGKSTM